MSTDIQVLKTGGKKEQFDKQKLLLSLVLAGATHDSAEAIVSEALMSLKDGVVASSDIYETALKTLRNAEHKAAARYSIRRAIAELGPTGFPFEKYVAEIFKAKGYEVLTDQVLTGACAVHEVDVVAYNDKELIVVEVKFHNELGIKTDLKVALYVKARHDDLRAVTHMIAGKERTFTDGMLITNTKFTQSAIGYALCEHLTLVGWNYPVKGNLEDLIIENGLYPITCLMSLTTAQKQALITEGIILVQQLKEHPDKCDEHVRNEISILFPL